MCKIQTSGKYNFAFAGGFSDEAQFEAKKATLKGGNHLVVGSAYIKSFGQLIENELNRYWKVSEKAYRDVVGEDFPSISKIFFLGVEADSLYLLYLRFDIIENVSNRTVKIKPFASYAIQGVVGHAEEIKDTINSKTVWNKGIVPTINNLIKIAMVAHPVEVGGKIDIIKVTRKKVEWVQKKTQCK